MAGSAAGGRQLTLAEMHVALALAEGPAHGYLLMGRVGDLGLQVGAATMYRTLRNMLADGFVAQDRLRPGQDARRQPYRLTEEGLHALALEGHRMAGLVGEAIGRRVPERFHSITPQLVVSDASAAIAFYSRSFGAVELVRKHHEDGRIVHAELRIGDSLVLLHDDLSDLGGPRAPRPGASGVTIHLFVPDADAVFRRAVDAGATALLPMEDRAWGDRYGILEDPFGHRWSIAWRRGARRD